MKKIEINQLENPGEVNMGSLDAYFKYLSKNLIFPVSGEVSQEESPFGERSYEAVLHNLCPPEDDFYGILGEGKSGRKFIAFALAEFSANDTDQNFQMIEEYKDWFWNNR